MIARDYIPRSARSDHRIQRESKGRLDKVLIWLVIVLVLALAVATDVPSAVVMAITP